MTVPEFSRPLGIDTLGEEPRRLGVEAEEAERVHLAHRFGLIAIGRLAADVALSRKADEIALVGTLTASVTQACVATGEPVEARIESPFAILFRPHPEAAVGEEEVELGESEMDVVFYDGRAIDVGEAVAETLLLNLDPYPRAPGAEGALKAAGVKSQEEAGNKGLPTFHGVEYDHMFDDPATQIDEAHNFEPHYDRHVWLYRPNANGMFAQFNPTVTCQFHKPVRVAKAGTDHAGH